MFFNEFIGDEYLNWQIGQVIIINTPTGSGKTTFFETQFKNHAFACGKRILYLTNRVILKKQMIDRQNRRIFEQETRTKSLWQNDFRKEPGNFEIITYQQLEHALLHRKQKEITYYRSFDIAIADECHYFLTDSNYNVNTIASFRFLMDNFRNKQLIFVSATIGKFYGFLINYINKITKQTDPFVNGMYPAYRFYAMDADYSGIEWGWITENKEIADKVASFPEESKILIFVPTIAEGKSIKEALAAVIPAKDILFLSSESKKTKKGMIVQQELVEAESFSYRVLIATSIIDTGINIMDESVKYIFLLQDCEEESVQMLGRRRRTAGEKIFVYLHARSQQYFQKKCKKLKYQLEYIENVSRTLIFNREYFDTRIAKDFYNIEKAEVLRKFVGVNCHPCMKYRYFINELSCEWLCQQLDEFEAVVDAFDLHDTGAWLFIQGSWYGLMESTLKFPEPHTYVQQIAEFVQTYLEKTMNVEQFNEFRSALMPLLHKANRQMFPKITENAKWQKINEFFLQSRIPYEISMNHKTKEKERNYQVKLAERGEMYE